MRRRAARLLALLLGAVPLGAAMPERADTALVLAVDVSGSVNPARYALQMQGIARALDDPELQANMLSGPHHAFLVALVEWSNRLVVSVPWRLVTRREEASAFAEMVRRAPRADDEFTCMSDALRLIGDKVLPLAPVPADRRIIDVSGDGHDNCNPPVRVDAVRDGLAADGVTVNGLPILDGDEAATLEAWYRDHVVGGPDHFELPARGYDDFARAMRAKFAQEISLRATPRYAGLAR